MNVDCDIQYEFQGVEHVSDDPLVQSGVPQPPEASERVVVVDAMLHVLA